MMRLPPYSNLQAVVLHSKEVTGLQGNEERTVLSEYESYIIPPIQVAIFGHMETFVKQVSGDKQPESRLSGGPQTTSPRVHPEHYVRSQGGPCLGKRTKDKIYI
jgi:hypothetical protein